jgi:uncharacterized membrane protein
MVDETKEVVVVGMSDSLRLMAFSAFAFVCMCALFTALFLNADTTFSVIIIASAGLGATLIIAMYMIMRYFTEQSIVYNAMNVHLKSTQCDCEERNN